MTVEQLIAQYMESKRPLKLTAASVFSLRSFADWADRQGYHLGQTKGDNGPAIFCARCGVYCMEAKPKGDE